MHNGDEKATVNRAIQIFDTPKNSERHPRNDTPKRRSIARSMLNNWATTKLTWWFHIYGGLSDSQEIFSVVMLCAPYKHQSRKVSETVKRICKTCLSEKSSYQPLAWFLLAIFPQINKSFNASWPQLLQWRQRLIPDMWTQKASKRMTSQMWNACKLHKVWTSLLLPFGRIIEVKWMG